MTRVDLKASARQKEVGEFTAYAGQMRLHAVFIMVRPVRLLATSCQPLKTSSDERQQCESQDLALVHWSDQEVTLLRLPVRWGHTIY